jgi:hypothetical protein
MPYFLGVFSSYLKIGGLMRRFDFWLPIDLFNRIKLMAQHYKVHISKMMIQLLEMGYLEMIKQGGYDNEVETKTYNK